MLKIKLYDEDNFTVVETFDSDGNCLQRFKEPLYWGEHIKIIMLDDNTIDIYKDYDLKDVCKED